MLSLEVCQLLAYWRSLGGGDGVPERSALDLRRLTSVLPWMFILEMAGDGSLRYRLVGSSLEEAIGRGMAGQTFGEVFADGSQAAFMEELYAVALVQSSGVLRTGSFKLHSDNAFNMEVLTLPFQDARAMGSTILVGAVRPFESDNRHFTDLWGQFDQQIDELLTIPSPRAVTSSLLSVRVHAFLAEHDLELRAMDLNKVIELDKRGMHDKHSEIPSLSLDALGASPASSLN